MKLKPLLIESFARYSIGSELFNDAIRITTSLIDKDLTGTEKRLEAERVLKEALSHIGTFAVEFAVMLAVGWLKSKGLIKS